MSPSRKNDRHGCNGLHTKKGLILYTSLDGEGPKQAAPRALALTPHDSLVIRALTTRSLATVLIAAVLMLGFLVSTILWILASHELRAEIKAPAYASSQDVPVLAPLSPEDELLAFGIGGPDMISSEGILGDDGSSLSADERSELRADAEDTADVADRVESAADTTSNHNARSNDDDSDRKNDNVDKVSDEVADAPAVPRGDVVRPVAGAKLTQGLHGHNGVDFGAKVGTAVLAFQGGVVSISEDAGWNGGYGTYVVIEHADGSQSLYAHLSENYVAVGQEVSAGETIGTVGLTGRTTGPHLHFEVHSGSNPFAY